MTRHIRGATRRRALIGVGVLALLLAGLASRVCLSTGFRYGLWLDQCPDGDLKQTIRVDLSNMSRGGAGVVVVHAFANYTTGPGDSRLTSELSGFVPEVQLLGGEQNVPLTPTEGWKASGTAQSGTVLLPKVNDGDYVVRTKVKSVLGESTLDVPLPLYAPARVHVLTDRPLYEPGNTVKFRAVVLKSLDLSPLDGRPGQWTVTNPAGEVLLEEKAPAGQWGVVSGSFPLDRGAQSGSWQVTWSSGGASESRAFTVKPFTLPRFRIEASAAKPFYRRNERPVLKGQVSYSSGAPVANAKVELGWHVNGEWPPPTSWADGTAFPKVATTNSSGAFSVELPVVPDDLRKQATIAISLGAVDAAGDRVEGSASILLSEDLIQVSGVSELTDGLVEGFNNRLFVRASTADGRVLEGVTLNVKRLWEPTDKGLDTEVDSDGVGRLQLDPGPPVNVVIPAMPFRPPPKVKAVQRAALEDLLAEEEISLADRLSFDRIESSLEVCARYVSNAGTSVDIGVEVHASGAIGGTVLPKSRLGECMARSLSALRFDAGPERLLHASYVFTDEEIPKLSAMTQGIPEPPEVVIEAINAALIDARDCLPSTVQSGLLPRLASWQYRPGAKTVSLTWSSAKDGTAYSSEVLSCVQGRVSTLTIRQRPVELEQEPDDAESQQPFGAVGIMRLQVEAPEKYAASRPQDTVMDGYEFLVTAKKGKEVIGTTRLVMSPGQIPPIRLRATSQIVRGGDKVTVEIIRGPDFTGELPEKLFLQHGYERHEAKVDEKTRSAEFVIPTDLEGWASVEWNGARVVFFIQPKSRLALKVSPEKRRYAPGQVAMLGVETTVGGVGGPAAVGLFGVDESLSQLAPLPGADELSHLRPQATSTAAFPGLDAEALAMGRVRGANAAAATLLRVASLPPAPEVESAQSGWGQTVFDPNEALVDRFYVVLQELHVQVERWESSAPANEKMTPRTMAKLWSTAIDAVEARKDSARDAWGRRLRLHRLPADLLALTEPRQVIINGTRLPEDNENWSQWVAKEQP